MGFKIDWKKHFDQIYCISFLGQMQKIPRLESELRRVGILRSGIFNMRYTSPSPYDDVIFDREREKGNRMIPNKGFVNLCLEIRRSLAEAIAFGYERILLLENDVAFLKDLKELDRLFGQVPHGCGIAQYDKFVNDYSVEDYRHRVACRKLNDAYFDGRGGFYTSAACIGLFGNGISEMKRLMDKSIWPTDIAYQKMRCGYAIAIKNLAIQVFYQESMSLKDCGLGLDYMHKIYRNADIDYSEYSIPLGYGYGKFIVG